MSIIQCKNVSKSFGEKIAIEDINLSIPSGGVFGLLGPNGAGKTTTIRILMNVFPAPSCA